MLEYYRPSICDFMVHVDVGKKFMAWWYIVEDQRRKTSEKGYLHVKLYFEQKNCGVN